MPIKPLKKKVVAKPAENSAPLDVKEEVRAVKILMEMSDGSKFVSEGDEANAIWHYQMECEQIANASGTMPSYLGPGMHRVTD